MSEITAHELLRLGFAHFSTSNRIPYNQFIRADKHWSGVSVVLAEDEHGNKFVEVSVFARLDDARSGLRDAVRCYGIGTIEQLQDLYLMVSGASLTYQAPTQRGD